MIRKDSDGSDTANPGNDSGPKPGRGSRGDDDENKRGSFEPELPLVAIVGRPNVGKSTLFNRFVGQRKAIVQNTPGVTRDRILGQVDWGEVRFHLVDTGGLDPVSSTAGLSGKIRSQIEKAFADADLLLFVVDGQGPVLPQDIEISRELRKTQKSILCVVNKVDTDSHEKNIYPYYRLGLEPLFPVSAEHGLGLPELLDHIVSKLPHSKEFVTEEKKTDLIRVAVVGRPNVGKSTLVNALLGEERQLVDEMPGTTRDAVDAGFRRGGRDFLLIDTAGIRRKGKVRAAVEKVAVIKALRSLDRCDVALLLLDASEGVTDQDAHIGGYILEKGRGVVIVVNKWDLVKNRIQKPGGFLKEVHGGLPHMQFAPVIPISARTGYNVNKALQKVARVENAFRTEVPTGPLNRLLEEAVKGHSPPSDGTRIRKFYYVTQIKKGPPTFLFFTNFSREVHFSYQRYLIRQIRSRFGFEGVPIRLVFRRRR